MVLGLRARHRRKDVASLVTSRSPLNAASRICPACPTVLPWQCWRAATASFVRSWRGDSSHDLASSSGTFDTSCSQLARWVPAPFDKRPGSPKGMGLRERWLLGAISPRQSLGQSPRGPCRSDSRARVLLGTDSQHAVVTCRCKPGTTPLDRRPASGTLSVCDMNSD